MTRHSPPNQSSAVVYPIRRHRNGRRGVRFIAELEDTGFVRAFRKRRKAVRWAKKKAEFVINIEPSPGASASEVKERRRMDKRMMARWLNTDSSAAHYVAKVGADGVVSLGRAPTSAVFGWGYGAMC